MLDDKETFMSKIGRTSTAATTYDFRRTFYPIPLLNPSSVLLCGVGVGIHVLGNWILAKPMISGIHYAFLCGCVGIWAGYHMNVHSYKRSMGKLKYSLDFVARNKDDFPQKEIPKFSDPDWLPMWRPVR